MQWVCTYMLDGMGHARHGILITEAPDIDIHGRTGLVCLGVMDYQNLELVREADDAVGAVVQGGLLQTICDQVDLAGDRGVRRGGRIGARGGHDVDWCNYL